MSWTVQRRVVRATPDGAAASPSDLDYAADPDELRPRVHMGEGAARALMALLGQRGARKVLLVCGAESLRQSGAEAHVRRIARSMKLHQFEVKSARPELDDMRRGVLEFHGSRPDAVVAIGGGKVLDVAKVIATVGPTAADPKQFILKKRALPGRRTVQLILVPTTAGTGSEATSFAVAYILGVKFSLDHPSLLADEAIIDPSLSDSMPLRLAAGSGLDALCQCIESYWSVRSTPHSRALAACGMRLALDNLEAACLEHRRAARQALCQAALLSGQAINITRTTAAHAMSYALSAAYGIGHGHACAITLPAFLEYNSQVTDRDVADGRGADFVRARIKDLLVHIRVSTPVAGAKHLRALVRAVGLEARISELGREGPSTQWLASQVNLERAQNNPRRVGHQALRQVLHACN